MPSRGCRDCEIAFSKTGVGGLEAALDTIDGTSAGTPLNAPLLRSVQLQQNSSKPVYSGGAAE